MRHRDRPAAEERVLVPAPPERIWPMISDPEFLVGIGPELRGVRWIDTSVTTGVGRRFVGTNANRHFGEWETISTVTECDEPRVFAWAVGDVDEPNSTWRFVLEPDDDGTWLAQQVRLGTGPSGLAVAISRMPDKEERIVERRMDEFRAAMRANIEAIRARAEAG